MRCSNSCIPAVVRLCGENGVYGRTLSKRHSGVKDKPA
jgi:hypothetical protein